jgi:Ca2+-binding EF-hand superfamily protein
MGQDYTDEELTKMITTADRDGNEEISFFEFCVLMATNVKNPEKKDEYAEAFKVFDRMANGYVDSVELV